MRELNLDILKEGLPGFTPGQGSYCREAAIVSLKNRGFESGVILKVYGDFEEKFAIIWEEEEASLAVENWKNENQAANFGAVAIASLLVIELLGYQRFEEGVIGTGIDYWLGKTYLRQDNMPYFQKEARIEISGIGKEAPGNTVSLRMYRKKKQISASDKTGLPGWIAIVEFSTPKSKIIKK